MHELGITQNIIAIVAEHAKDRKVLKVTLQIGALSAIIPESIRFFFEVCAEGTPVAGAQLEIETIAGLGKCNPCGKELTLSILAGTCACGSRDITCIAGQELKIKDMEVE
jgi:hydrogenase nickel incorporation protein HypA/HybF